VARRRSKGRARTWVWVAAAASKAARVALRNAAMSAGGRARMGPSAGSSSAARRWVSQAGDRVMAVSGSGLFGVGSRRATMLRDKARRMDS
jgi:hypothetical protein